MTSSSCFQKHILLLALLSFSLVFLGLCTSFSSGFISGLKNRKPGRITLKLKVTTSKAFSNPQIPTEDYAKSELSQQQVVLVVPAILEEYTSGTKNSQSAAERSTSGQKFAFSPNKSPSSPPPIQSASFESTGGAACKSLKQEGIHRIAIVGNGPLADQDRRDISEMDIEVRFNNLDNRWAWFLLFPVFPPFWCIDFWKLKTFWTTWSFPVGRMDKGCRPRQKTVCAFKRTSVLSRIPVARLGFLRIFCVLCTELYSPLKVSLVVHLEHKSITQAILRMEGNSAESEFLSFQAGRRRHGFLVGEIQWSVSGHRPILGLWNPTARKHYNDHIEHRGSGTGKPCLQRKP